MNSPLLSRPDLNLTATDWKPVAADSSQYTGSKQAIARGFGGASATYDSASRLQKHMGDAMLAALVVDRPESLLDLGCGTGWYTRKLTERFPGAIVTGADLSPGMLRQAAGSGIARARWLQADAEALPLADRSMDLVFTNLMIQWSHHPEAVLAECRRLLRPGGVLAMSTLLDGTLDELKQAWSVADPGQPHVNRFEEAARWRALTEQMLPGSELVVDDIVLPYDSPMALNRELKHLGAVFKGEGRRQTVTSPGRFRAMCRAYPGSEAGEATATYRAGYLYWINPS
ncbi:MAG: malonyl-[acyl-carrier protein] O-methyltransferase BioC [Marinobacter sp. 34-60-7]|nr:MAG: malonyl-[acyl-carrier protein] O-methyltransferase BioC [Marinobacter sp. 34-60-7]